MELSPEERAALAASLINSLDQTVDPQVEAEWEKEIERRLAEIDSGERTIPWSEARRKILGNCWPVTGSDSTRKRQRRPGRRFSRIANAIQPPRVCFWPSSIVPSN